MARELLSTDTALDKLLKSLPAEITGAYLAIRTIASTQDNSDDIKLLWFAVAILFISPFFMKFVLKIGSVPFICFLMVSYVIWVANIDLQRLVINADTIVSAFPDNYSLWVKDIIDPFAIKATLVLWAVLLLPIVLVVRGQEQ